MKKYLLILIALVCFASVAESAIKYDGNYYLRNRRFALSGDTADPIYGFINEMDNFASGGGTGTGSIFYVDGLVVTEGDGRSWDRAKDTLQEAIDLCEDGRGDVIYVAEMGGEVLETAAQIDVDCAGISIIGKGSGKSRPTYTFTETVATFAVTAANVRLENLRLHAYKSEVAVGLDLSAAADNCTIIGCDFSEPSGETSHEFLAAIKLASGTDNFLIANCTGFSADAAGAASWLDMTAGVNKNPMIINCTVFGDYSAAGIYSNKADEEVYILGGQYTNIHAGVHAIEFSAAATGWVRDVAVSTDAIGTSLDPGAMDTDLSVVWSEYGVEDSAPVPLFGGLNSTTLNTILADTEAWDTAGEAQTLLFGSATPGATATALATAQTDLDILTGAGGVGTGDIFYVDSASAGGAGTSWATAKQTLSEASALCADNNGDYIYVAAGHNEDWTGINSGVLGVIGVTVEGKGTGTDRPRFDYNDADAELVIGAANVRISNLTFQPGITGVVHAIEVEDDADGSIIENCEFLDGESEADDEFLDAIQLAAGADDLIISNNVATETTAGANNWLDLSVGIVDRVTVINNLIRGDYAEGGIYSDKVLTNAYIAGNVATNTHTGIGALVFSAAATGTCIDNVAACDTPSAALDPGSMENVGNSILDYDAAEDADAGPAWACWTGGATGNYPDNVENDSLIAFILSKSATAAASSYDNETDSLQMLSDKLGGYTGDGGTDENDSVYAAITATDANVTAILDDTGTSGVVVGTYVGDAINAAAIAAGAIDAATFAAGAIDATAIANDAIDATAIAAGAIDAATWAADILPVLEGEATDAIEADLLNFLYSAADGGTNVYPDSVVTESALAYLMVTGVNPNINTYDNTSMSLQALNVDLDAILDDTGTSGVVVGSFAADSITAAAIANDAIGATEIAIGAIAADAFAAGAIDAGAIAADAITTSELATGCISSDEIADGAIDAGAIANAAIDAATFAAGAIDATAIATDAIGAAELAADCIGTAELATGCISADEVADNAIDAGAIANGAIDAATFAAGAIDAAAIATSAITDDEIAANAIGESELAADCITNSEIATDAIGADEIAADAIGASEIATDAIDADALAADALTEIQASVTAAMEADFLDHLVSADDASGAEAYPTSVVSESVFAFLMCTGADPVITTFDNTTMSLQALNVDLDAILADTGTTGVLIGADALGAANIADNAIANEHFANDALTDTELATDCIGADEVADDAIDAGAIADAAIDAAAFAAGAVDAAAIADAAIDAATYAVAIRPTQILAIQTSNFNGNAYQVADSPVTIATVTGDVLVRIVATVDTACTSAGGNTGTLELGTTDSTAALLVSDVVDGLAFQPGDVWTQAAGPDDDIGLFADDWSVVGGGEDIILTVAIQDMTAGIINFYIEWRPLSTDGNITDSAP